MSRIYFGLVFSGSLALFLPGLATAQPAVAGQAAQAPSPQAGSGVGAATGQAVQPPAAEMPTTAQGSEVSPPLPPPAPAQDASVAPAYAAELNPVIEERPLNRISISPIPFALLIANFSYERALSDHLGLEFTTAFGYYGFDGNENVYGFGAGAALAFYPSGTAPKGMRFTGRMFSGFVGIDDGDGSNEKAFVYSGQALIGYQWIFRSGFSLGLHGGAQFLHINSNEARAFNSILPAGDFTLGFAF